VPQSADFTPNTDELLANNEAYVAQFADHGLQLSPKRHLAVVACMDSRMDIFEMLGLKHGDAHIIRNAGGVVTDDVVRSLVVSQRLLNTQEIILIHHTNCGLQTVSEDEFKHQIEAECGIKPWWALETFGDPYVDVRQSMARLHHSPFVVHKDHIRGFVYDVDSGALNEVEADPRHID
jgi:carbonic anhydrase